MAYNVIWLRGEEELSRARFHDLNLAKNHARERLLVHRRRRGATAAEIVDDFGIKHFRHGDEPDA